MAAQHLARSRHRLMQLLVLGLTTALIPIAGVFWLVRDAIMTLPGALAGAGFVMLAAYLIMRTR